ncbi:MAG: GTPase [Thermoguttaceae bacterium]|nr:GTPase [Thermoguttaceae bacterium]
MVVASVGMVDPNSFCITRLTAPGPAAIATVRAEGPGAAGAVAVHVRPRSGGSLEAHPVDRPLLGLFGEAPGEPVVLHRRGDGAVEIHCHGGMAAVERIEHTLAADGAHIVGWQEWVRSRSADPIAAEARIAMAHARTERTAAILLDQYGGALRRAMAEVERLIAVGKQAAAREQIDSLLARAEVGRHLTRSWRVVLAGRPNVGKSSLLNALLGYERAIVHSTAGTTRDVLSATTAISGWPVELVDTAGSPSATIPRSGDAVLERGIALGQEQMATADLLVLVFDRTVSISAEEESWLHDGRRVLPVDNKADLPRAFGPRPPALETSALRGEGLAELLDAIAHRLVPAPPPPGAAVPFVEEQCTRLRTLADGLA